MAAVTSEAPQLFPGPFGEFKSALDSRETKISNLPGPVLQRAGAPEALGCAAARHGEGAGVSSPKGGLKLFLMREYLEAGGEEGRCFPVICGLLSGRPCCQVLGNLMTFVANWKNRRHM